MRGRECDVTLNHLAPPRSAKSDRVKGMTVESDRVKGMTVESDRVKGTTVESDRVKGTTVESATDRDWQCN